jgi:hypothetical protein
MCVVISGERIAAATIAVARAVPKLQRRYTGIDHPYRLHREPKFTAASKT